MKCFKAVFFLILFSLACISESFSGEFRFVIDSRHEISALLNAKEALGTVKRNNYSIETDASSVSQVSFQNLLAVALDYNEYENREVPNVKKCEVIEMKSNHPSVVWCEMSLFGVISKHYLAVEVIEISATQAGIRWELITQPNSKWKYPSLPSVSRLDGSWYLEKLEDGLVYTRYFLSLELVSQVPKPIIDLVVGGRLLKGVKKVISVMQQSAKTLP